MNEKFEEANMTLEKRVEQIFSTNPIVQVPFDSNTVCACIFKNSTLGMPGFGPDTLFIYGESHPFIQSYRGKELIKFPMFYLTANLMDVNTETIPSTAQFMVTPTLTGCSFVAQLNSAMPKVSHINRQVSEDGNTDPIQMEEDINELTSGSDNYFIIRKKDYYNLQVRAPLVVMGIKKK